MDTSETYTKMRWKATSDMGYGDTTLLGKVTQVLDYAVLEW